MFIFFTASSILKALFSIFELDCFVFNYLEAFRASIAFPSMSEFAALALFLAKSAAFCVLRFALSTLERAFRKQTVPLAMKNLQWKSEAKQSEAK